ncbi:MAG: stage II sporulation protein M [Candidatus Woesearchaeota archaeon]
MLENILKPDWLERTPRYAFIIGIVYSIIGIISAYIVFPRSQGIASIAFISMLLIPSLNKMFTIEEQQDRTSRKFSIKKIFQDHNDILQVYFMLFLGIFLTYALFSIKFPNLLVNGVFDSQLRIIGVNVGQATGGLSFYGIFTNNVKIMLIFIVLSLVFGAGSIIFLAWNASVWGVVFGYLATHYANALDNFIITFIKVTPHMFLEAGAYFFAIVAGGIMSQAVLRESIASKKFDYVLKDGFIFLTVGMILLVLGALVEVYVYNLF